MKKIILTMATSAMALSLGVSAMAHARTLRVFDYLVDPDGVLARWESTVSKDFKKQTGADLNWMHKENDSYKIAIKVVMKSSNPPDVYQNWDGSDAAEFINAGYSMDISDWIKELKAKNYNPPAFYDLYGVYKGKHYGLALYQAAKYMYYNKALFKQYNIQIPKTFNDVLNICTTMKSKNKRISPLVLGNLNKWRAIHFMSQLNGYYIPISTLKNDYFGYTSASKLFTNPGYIKALKRLKSLNTSKCFERSPNTSSATIADALFVNNKALMDYSGIWNDKKFATALGKNLGVISRLPLPQDALVKNVQDYNFGFSEGYMVYKNTKNKDLAKAFLNSVAKAKNIIYKDRYSDFVINDLKTLKHEIPVTDIFMDNRVSETYLTNVQNMIGGSMTPEQVIAGTRKIALKVKAQQKK